MNHRMMGDLPAGMGSVGVPIVGVGGAASVPLMWPEFPNNAKEALQQIGEYDKLSVS